MTKEELKDIDAIELIEARNKEIQFIEASIMKTNKKTMLFQRLPFYKRRRNRNYDKRKVKKFVYRKKDRHFLRTHTFYSKRFFMLKLISNTDKCLDISIPIKRRIKSAKYIYKSQDRGFLFDESFRGGFIYDTKKLLQDIFNKDEIKGDIKEIPTKDSNEIKRDIKQIPTIVRISKNAFMNSIDLTKYNQIQTIDNLYDVIITETKTYVIGAILEGTLAIPIEIECTLSILKKEDYGFFELKGLISNKAIQKDSTGETSTFDALKENVAILPTGPNEPIEIFPDHQGGIQSYKILCKRSQVMTIFQLLITNSIIPICLDEVHRIALENDQMTVYDNIKGNLFKTIEQSINKEIIEKYDRTPKSKRVNINTEELNIFDDINERGGIDRRVDLPCDNPLVYCSFVALKGNPKTGGYIYEEEIPVGRILRSGYKFTNGKCYGLCVFYPNVKLENKVRTFRNLGQSAYYKIEINKLMGNDLADQKHKSIVA